MLDALSIGKTTNFFWKASRQLMTSICFRTRLGLDGLILVLRCEVFLLTVVNKADFQGIRDSADIFYQITTFL